MLNKIQKNMFEGKIKETKKDIIKRNEKDFVTEIMYIPRKKGRVILFALFAFFYFVLSPRFFYNINIKKQINSEFHAYRSIITKIASDCGVPPALIAAMIKVESNFRHNVTSKAGAAGLMQLLPSTAKQFNVTNLYDPEQNIRAGALYIKSLLDHFSGNLMLAVAAYNAGPINVKKYSGIPPFKETQRYVTKVKKSINEFRDYF